MADNDVASEKVLKASFNDSKTFDRVRMIHMSITDDTKRALFKWRLSNSGDAAVVSEFELQFQNGSVTTFLDGRPQSTIKALNGWNALVSLFVDGPTNRDIPEEIRALAVTAGVTLLDV